MSISPHPTEPLPAVEPATLVARPRLRDAVESAQFADRSICVVHIDLDRFHQVNQRWGQQLGDQVLDAVGHALLGVLPDQSLLAVTEGDAFVVLVAADTFAAAREQAESLLLAVRQPVVLGDLLLTIEASAGFAQHSAGEAPDDLLEHAFLACRRAKATMRGSAFGYESSLGADASLRMRTEDALRAAIGQNELRLHLQPTVDLRDGRVVGVEALVRWQHPVEGLLPPAEFLPLAVSAGLMSSVGDWVLSEAIRIAARWRRERPSDSLRIWVNLAAEQLADGHHVYDQVRRAMDLGDVQAHDIGFEVTESSLLQDLPSAVETLSALRGLGLEIALDDFGTGYSSLTYLQQLPVTAVKIDRSFVAGIGGSLADEAIIEAVIDLAHALGLRVIAEGIEDLSQAEALIRMGADEAQGYHFSHPMAPDLIESRLILPWCGAERPARSPGQPADRRADELPGFGSARARLLLRALDTVHDSIIVTTAARGSAGSPPIVYVNAAFENETGWRSAEMVGGTIEALLADPSDAELARWFESVHTGAASTTREVASRRADGSTFLCEIALSPILDERGIHTHWLHVRRDLTQRRSEENHRARFQAVIEQSSTLVAMVETGGEWVYANSAQRRAIGLGADDALDTLRGVSALGVDEDRLMSQAAPALQSAGRWSGPVTFVNPATGAVTEVISDIHVLDDPLRPGVKIYAAVSQDMSATNAQERHERRRSELFRFASDLAHRALSTGRDELFQDFHQVLEACGNLLGADFAYLDVIDGDAGTLRQLSAWQNDRGPRRPEPPPMVDLNRLPHWIERLRQRGVLIGRGSESTLWALELDDAFPGPGFGTNLYTGLTVGGALVGVFGLSHRNPEHTWTDDELSTVQQIADTVANLLGRELADVSRREAERHVNAILSNVRDIVVVIDGEGWIRYANPQIEVSIGRSPAEVTGVHFLTLVHPDDAEMALERFADTLAGHQMLPVTELRLVHADGSTSWYDIDTSGVADPVLGGYVVSLRNVDGHHALADLVARRHELEQIVLELSHWALNVEHEFIDEGLTEHIARLGSVLAADAAGLWLIDGPTIRTAAQWTVGHTGSQIANVQAFDAPALAARLGALDRGVVVADIEALPSDGALVERWVEEWRALPGHERSALLLPLASAGVSHGFVGVTMTSTPRSWNDDEVALVRRVADVIAALLARRSVEASLRDSETRLTALLDNSLDLVVVINSQGDVLYANRTAQRRLGYSAEEILLANMADIIHPDDLSLAASRLASLLAFVPTDLTTLRLRTRSGGQLWVEIISGQDTLVAGGTLLTGRDVTERHAVEVAAAGRMDHLRYAFEVAQAALDLDAEEFLGQLGGVCRRIGDMLGVDLVYVDQVDERQHILINLAGCVGNGGFQKVQPGETLTFAELPLWVERLRRLDPVVVDDAALSTEPWAIEKRNALGSEGGLMAVAMSAAGELFGVLGVSMVSDARAWTDDELTFLRIIGETIAHVLERARVDDALRRSETRFRLMSDTAADVVLLTDPLGVIQYASPSSMNLLGFRPDELIGQVAQAMVHPDDAHTVSAVGATHLHNGQPLTSECRLIRADGTEVWVANSISAVLEPETGRAVGYRASVRDISDRKRLEAALEDQALHDPLTGLGNRILLQQRLQRASRSTDVSRHELAVLLVDLDGFKAVNDTYGHAVGDDVLRIVSARLQALTRQQDTLARTGGDEFVVICPSTSAADAVQIGERIVHAASQPLATNGTVIHLGASVGVAHHIGTTDDPDWLLIDADHAMYAAKREGRGRVRIAESANSAGPSAALPLRTPTAGQEALALGI